MEKFLSFNYDNEMVNGCVEDSIQCFFLDIHMLKYQSYIVITKIAFLLLIYNSNTIKLIRINSSFYMKSEYETINPC